MLMTCATHLMSVTVVSRYWENKPIGGIRVLLITALYIVTGLLMANQNVSDSGPRFPTAIPPPDTNNTLMILPAACFQPDTDLLDDTLNQTFASGSEAFGTTIADSTPRNHIVGWNFFILMILWYGLAMVAEVIRLCFHRRGQFQEQATGLPKKAARWAYWVFWVYQLGGVVFCMVAIIYSFEYIRGLRGWMNASGWIRLDHGGNPENNPTTFGQLVPLLLILLSVYVVLEAFSDKWNEHRQRMKRERKNTGDPEGLQSPPPNGNCPFPPDKKDDFTVNATSVPPTPLVDDQNEMQIQPMQPSRPQPHGTPMNVQSPTQHHRPQPTNQSPTPSYHSQAHGSPLNSSPPQAYAAPTSTLPPIQTYRPQPSNQSPTSSYHSQINGGQSPPPQRLRSTVFVDPRIWTARVA